MKEYGEGIDRMCRELEAIGLPDPVFNNSTFILKTTVMSADRDQMIAENARIEHIKSLRAKGMMTAITSSAIISVLEDLRENQVIGTQDI